MSKFVMVHNGPTGVIGGGDTRPTPLELPSTAPTKQEPTANAGAAVCGCLKKGAAMRLPTTNTAENKPDACPWCHGTAGTATTNAGSSSNMPTPLALPTMTF